MRCISCGKGLTGKLDTFGGHNAEQCLSCWLRDRDDDDQVWYGLGPHEHTFDDHGQIVMGGTRLKPLPKRELNGAYKIDGLYFIPDPDAPGCGIWSTRP